MGQILSEQLSVQYSFYVLKCLIVCEIKYTFIKLSEIFAKEYPPQQIHDDPGGQRHPRDLTYQDLPYPAFAEYAGYIRHHNCLKPADPR